MGVAIAQFLQDWVHLSLTPILLSSIQHSGILYFSLGSSPSLGQLFFLWAIFFFQATFFLLGNLPSFGHIIFFGATFFLWGNFFSLGHIIFFWANIFLLATFYLFWQLFSLDIIFLLGNFFLLGILFSFGQLFWQLFFFWVTFFLLGNFFFFGHFLYSNKGLLAKCSSTNVPSFGQIVNFQNVEKIYKNIVYSFTAISSSNTQIRLQLCTPMRF